MGHELPFYSGFPTPMEVVTEAVTEDLTPDPGKEVTRKVTEEITENYQFENQGVDLTCLNVMCAQKLCTSAIKSLAS